MCPFCFGSVMLLAGSVVSVVSGGGFAAVAVKRFAERLESTKSSLNPTSQGGSVASQSNTKQHKATQSNTKQHKATQSNTKQHKATQSNTISHQVVSPAEWLAARKELLQKEKELYAHARCHRSAKKRIAVGKSRQGLQLRRTGRQTDACRSFFRQTPTAHLPFQVWAGVEGRLPQLFAGARQF
jgi:hypothetical protein